MQKFPAFFIDDQTIVAYLRKYGRGVNTTDYELAAAVWVNRIFNDLKKTIHCIGFEMRESLPSNLDFSNLEIIKGILEKRRQDTPIDFILVDGIPSKHAPAGYGFQIKRFPYKQKDEKDFYDKLVEFINEKAKSRPDEVGLIVIPEPEGKFNFEPEKIKALSGKLVIPEESFKKVIFLMGNYKEAHLVEVYPDVLYFKAASL